MASSAELISAKCDQVKALLLHKNSSYGNSALHPVRIFSRADAAAGLQVRIDDKLSRIASGSTCYNEDTVLDLIGYLVLYSIAQEEAAAISSNADADYAGGGGGGGGAGGALAMAARAIGVQGDGSCSQATLHHGLPRKQPPA